MRFIITNEGIYQSHTIVHNNLKRQSTLASGFEIMAWSQLRLGRSTPRMEESSGTTKGDSDGQGPINRVSVKSGCKSSARLIVEGACRKTRANRFTITESSLVHLVARKARPEIQCSAASKRCCSPLASLRCYNQCCSSSCLQRSRKELLHPPLILLLAAPSAGADNTQHAIQLLTCLLARPLQLLKTR